MNQLQNLLHDALISTQHVEKCALLNKDDYVVKAASIGFQVNFKATLLFHTLLTLSKLRESEIEAFIDAFNNTSLARDCGIYFNDKIYTCLRADEKSIYAKNVQSIYYLYWLTDQAFNYYAIKGCKRFSIGTNS